MFSRSGIADKAFFGPGRVSIGQPPAPKPVSSAQQTMKAGSGGDPGFSYTVLGWAGNNGTGVGQTTGTWVSGSLQVINSGSYICIGNATAGAGPLDLHLTKPFFMVSRSGADPQNLFTSITVGGVTYLTANAFFDNGGGCSAAIWGWQLTAPITNGSNFGASLS
jgi:hypothetical protein